MQKRQISTLLSQIRNTTLALGGTVVLASGMFGASSAHAQNEGGEKTAHEASPSEDSEPAKEADKPTSAKANAKADGEKTKESDAAKEAPAASADETPALPAETPPSETAPAQQKAAPTAAAPAPIDVDAIKRQLKEELRTELKQQFQADMEAAARDATSQSKAAGEWEEERWVEEVKPKLNFLEFNGYFRTRFDLMNGLDLGTYDPTYAGGLGRGTSSVAPPTMYRPFDGEAGCGDVVGDAEPTGFPGQLCQSSTANTQRLISANMRLRLDPTLNVSEDIRIRATVDMMDNLVLGSTPESRPGFANNPTLPLPLFASNQNAVQAGLNSIYDAVRIKRLWAEVMTPFGLLRVGRQPQNWGLGLLVNGGNGIDDNYGDQSDSILFATKVFGHYIVPSYSFSSTGPNGRGGGGGVPSDNNLTFFPGEQGQRYNLDPSDDVHSFILTVVKKDKEEDIKAKLQNGGFVLNYGAFAVYRRQSYDIPAFFADVNPQTNPATSIDQYVRRNANVGVTSLWGRFQWDKLRIEAEAVGIVGKIDGTSTSSNGITSVNNALRYKDSGAGGLFDNGGLLGPGNCTTVDTPDGPVDVCDAPLFIGQGGLAFESSYRLLNDSLEIGFDFGIASGDNAPGWGMRPVINQQPEPGDFDGLQYGECFAADGTVDVGSGDNAVNGVCADRAGLDNNVTNFKFDPSYQVDLILFRQVLGTVTNAAYVKPHVSYYLTESIGARLDLIYSQAIYKSSTTGCAADAAGSAISGLNCPIGLEADATAFYGSDDGFYLMLQGGLLLPFRALNQARDPANPDHGLVYNNGAQVNDRFLDAGLAYTLQAFAGVQF